MQMRTDGVSGRESAGTGSVILKVVPVTGAAAFAGRHGPINVRLSFPSPTIELLVLFWYWYKVGMLKVSEYCTGFIGSRTSNRKNHREAVLLCVF